MVSLSQVHIFGGNFPRFDCCFCDNEHDLFTSFCIVFKTNELFFLHFSYLLTLNDMLCNCQRCFAQNFTISEVYVEHTYSKWSV